MSNNKNKNNNNNNNNNNKQISLSDFINEEKLTKIKTIYLNYANLDYFKSFENNFLNLEMLSLQNNNLSNFNFIKFLPNLWYFDIRNNPISNYDPLIYKNIFGFLGLSIDKYLEKSLLQIKRLIIGTLFVDLDENYKKNFLSNNPNILLYNNELVLEIHKNNKKEINSTNKDMKILSK
jgi:hypothetical protein